jgi:hypothetical protein
MTFLGAALSSLAQGVYKPRLTDFGGGKNAKSLYELSRRCNDLSDHALLTASEEMDIRSVPAKNRLKAACL